MRPLRSLVRNVPDVIIAKIARDNRQNDAKIRCEKLRTEKNNCQCQCHSERAVKSVRYCHLAPSANLTEIPQNLYFRKLNEFPLLKNQNHSALFNSVNQGLWRRARPQTAIIQNFLLSVSRKKQAIGKAPLILAAWCLKEQPVVFWTISRAMTAKSIRQIFDQYQRARLSFVKSVAELSLKSNNVPILDELDVLELLRPLLHDVCKQVQHCATIALGRIVQHDPAIAKKFAQADLLPLLLENLNKANKYQKTSILFILRSLCKHGPEMANFVIQSGGMHVVISSLEDFEPSVKEAAGWVVGYVARHSQALAEKCVEYGALPLLILCLQEPHLSLKQIAASALSDIAKHNIVLAQNVLDAGAIPYLAKNLNNLDEKLKKTILMALSSCAQHSPEIAEVVVEAEVFPSVFMHMAHACPTVRKNAASLVRDIVKHSLELTQLIVNTGGIGALMEVLHQDPGEARIPCITALGYIAGHSDQLAMSVLGCRAIVELGTILNQSDDEALLAVTAWTLGQIGKHSPEHAKAVASANLFPRLVELYGSDGSEDLRLKCKNALKQCLQKCLVLSALEPLLHNAHASILKYVLGQYSKILPHDPKARRLFVTSGGLQKMQQIEAPVGSTLMEYITMINYCFPEEIVRYYSPGYPDTLLDKVEQYSPQMMAVLHENEVKDDDAEVTTLLSQSTPSQELQKMLIG